MGSLFIQFNMMKLCTILLALFGNLLAQNVTVNGTLWQNDTFWQNGTLNGTLGRSFGTECPPMEAVICEDGMVSCDNGMDYYGCWMGNWCQAADMECPHVCPPMEGVICEDGMVSCDNGMDHYGCWMGNWCQAADMECPHVCPPMEGAICEDGMVSCDNGMDHYGCWMGNWCQAAD